ncbi:uncharacterized protein TRIADDRAFT_25311 [Trichoplax adhaerens]|uniref:Cation efflux protein transmembrane domain-containing protein n=1 Tax=Trichoplax adhaerens TaxID=10228 RepID=B3RX82_TRIAD|nr:hypothetical protein TRIADDRAFT_25311 [Trichoplax adhaerens]EDV24370.1 hypothetical protein TRIADDRAFT_25311 [Trichoplax adhaerens]|eukprot:XP_002112260.1 hypothetical protein TRIADDRAFT_25311 [Trichoplax adhaerens]
MCFKLLAYIWTGSASMLSEGIHSLADVANQCLLLYGIFYSLRQPSPDHPYGFSRARYVYALISGVGIFCVGAGVNIYHGISLLMNPHQLESLLVAYSILAGSFVVEGATLMAAITQVRKNATETGLTFKEYVLKGRDPNVVAVLLEDGIAVAGVSLAGICLALASLTGNPLYDAAGSIAVGGMLGVMALFLIQRNGDALVGRSIPYNRLRQIVELIENDVMIRSIHDVKATELGADTVRFKAEINFDGREVTRSYANNIDLEELLVRVKEIKTVEELNEFILHHGERIIDVLGVEVDRIEKNIKKASPEVRHVDLEIL